jgi:hypothetical protein
MHAGLRGEWAPAMQPRSVQTERERERQTSNDRVWQA